MRASDIAVNDGCGILARDTQMIIISKSSAELAQRDRARRHPLVHSPSSTALKTTRRYGEVPPISVHTEVVRRRSGGASVPSDVPGSFYAASPTQGHLTVSLPRSAPRNYGALIKDFRQTAFQRAVYGRLRPFPEVPDVRLCPLEALHPSHSISASRSVQASSSANASSQLPSTCGSSSISPLSLRITRFVKLRAPWCTEQDAWITTLPRAAGGSGRSVLGVLTGCSSGRRRCRSGGVGRRAG